MINKNKLLLTPFLFLLFYFLFLSGCGDNAENPKSTIDKNGVVIISNPQYGPWQKLEKPPLSLKLIDQFNFQDHLLVGNISYLVSDAESNLYFLDQTQNKLISIDSKGNIRWQTGQQGRGPGDFEYPFGVVTDGKFLYIGNIMATRLDKFDLNGNFIRSYDFGSELYLGIPLGITSEGHAVIRTGYNGHLGNTINMVEINTDSLNILDIYQYDQTNGLEIPERGDSGPDIKFHEDKILEGNLFEYSITHYNLANNPVKKVTRDFDKIIRPGTASLNGRPAVSIFGMVNAPYYLSNGYYFVRAEWPLNLNNPDKIAEDKLKGVETKVKYRNSLDLFSPEDELLYSYEWNGKETEFGKLLHVDKKDYLYFVKSTPKPAIYKYQLLLN